MEVSTNLPIQDSYRERARRVNLIYHPNIELINCGFHRGVLGASSALTRSHIGYQIPGGATGAMSSLQVDASSPADWGAELLFTS
jgi:hypothetical protein